MNAALLSLGLLLMRVAASLGMFFGHGLGKIQKYDELSKNFPDPLNIGSTASLIGAIAGEVACPALVAIGLMTRFAALGAAFTMGVAAFMIHANDPLFGMPPAKEPALLYLTLFGTLVFTGPGRVSLDALIFRQGRGAVATPTLASTPRNETRPI